MSQSTLTIGGWYLSKNGSLCRLDTLPQNGEWYATVTSGHTGNQLKIPVQETTFFTPTNPPVNKKSEEERIFQEKLAEKYKLRQQKVEEKAAKRAEKKLQNTDNLENKIEVKVKEKVVKNTTSFYDKYPHVVHDSIYLEEETGKKKCKIKCTKCNSERIIKVQDAFIVKLCVECKEKKNAKTI